MAQNPQYAEIISLDDKPVIIYADSCRTEICKVLQPGKASGAVSIRHSASGMFGDKIWLYENGELLPEFTGWMDKDKCFRHLSTDSDNCSYIYAKPDENSPHMQILSNRGLLVNVIDYKSDWLKVRFLYHRIVEGWVRNTIFNGKVRPS